MLLHSPEGSALGFMLVGLIIVFAPWLVERVRLPGVIGLLAGGALIGEHGFNVLHRPEVLESVGGFGLLYLMFLAGLELDLPAFFAVRRIAVSFGLLTFAVPFAAALVAAVSLNYSAAAAVLIGSLFASHTLITYPEFRRLGVSGNRAVASAVGATIITDTIALVVLAVVAGLKSDSGGGLLLAGKVASGLAVLVAYSLGVLPWVARRVYRGVGQEAVSRFVFTAAAFASAGVVAEVVGIEGIVGAFFAGLGLNRLVPAHSPLMERIEFVGSAMFVPAFLVSVGTLVDPKLIATLDTIKLAAAFLGALVVGKAVAAWVAGRVFGMSPAEIGAMISLSLAQAAATLAATVIGKELHLFGDDVVNAVILVIVLSILLSSVLAAKVGPKLATEPSTHRELGACVVVVSGAEATAGGPAAAALVAATTLAAELAAGARGVVVALAILTGEATPEALRSARSALATMTSAVAGRGGEVHPVLRIDSSAGAALRAVCLEQDASSVIVPSTGLSSGDLHDLVSASPVVVATAYGEALSMSPLSLELEPGDLGRHERDVTAALEFLVAAAGSDRRATVTTADEEAAAWLAEQALPKNVTVGGSSVTPAAGAGALPVTIKRSRLPGRGQPATAGPVVVVRGPASNGGARRDGIPSRVAVGRSS